MPASDRRNTPGRHQPSWLRTTRGHLARMEPHAAVATAQALLDEARAREDGLLQNSVAPLFRPGRPLVLRPEDRVPQPLLLLPSRRVETP